ncbi:hypothetical protein CP8484711_1652A, partial [Chlamydia psittaci 84-8471/1]
MSASKASP